MGLQQQLDALKAEFTRTAPAGRPALYEAKIDELRRSVAQEHTLGVGDADTIADISAWGWLDRASRVRKGAEDPLVPYPNLKRLFAAVDARPAVARARAVGKGHAFKKVNDEETKRALFPSNFPLAL